MNDEGNAIQITDEFAWEIIQICEQADSFFTAQVERGAVGNEEMLRRMADQSRTVAVLLEFLIKGNAGINDDTRRKL